MPRVTYEVLSPAEKIKRCKELMQSLFEEKQKVYLDEFKYYLTTELIPFNPRTENQQSQCIKMQSMLNTGTSTITNETSSKPIFDRQSISRAIKNFIC